MYYTPPAVRPTAQNGPGTAGFVLGIIGLVFSLIPIVGVIAWVICAVGMPLAGVGMRRVNQGAADNRGVTIAGLVLNAVALVVCTGWLAFTTVAVANQH